MASSMATAIRVSSGSERPGALVLDFDRSLHDVTSAGFGRDPTATFTVAVDAHTGLVRGQVLPREMGFDLLPEQPTWAATHGLHVELARSGAIWRLGSVIRHPGLPGQCPAVAVPEVLDVVRAAHVSRRRPTPPPMPAAPSRRRLHT